MKTAFFENNGGGVCAVVKDDSGAYVNFIPGFEAENAPVSDLFCAALGGFENAYAYDPDNYSGIPLDDMCRMTEADTPLIAEISDTEIILYIKAMGIAGKKLFGVEVDV